MEPTLPGGRSFARRGNIRAMSCSSRTAVGPMPGTSCQPRHCGESLQILASGSDQDAALHALASLLRED